MKYWDKAWSCVSGCTPVSPACDNCWLQTMHYRFHAAGKSFHQVESRPDRLDLPLKTKKSTTFAIWSDLFHPEVAENFIDKAYEVMLSATQHKYLICTKRPERMADFFRQTFRNPFDRNIFLGTTVENQEMTDKRIPELLKCKPFKLFLSVEPLLSQIIIPQEELKQISVVICGCESGHHARETKIEWVEGLRKQCIEANVPLWVKQLKVNGKMVYDHPLSTIKKEDLWK